MVGFTMSAGPLVPISVRTALAGQPYWLQIIEIVVLVDIGTYFLHRALHTIPWLWKFHAIHHSSEELDWLSAYRNHPLELILSKAALLLPVFLIGFSDVAIGGSMLLYGTQNLFVHANLRIKFGPLRWLWASPEFHHWHHSRDHEARDKNFSTFLPLLDILFGTFYMPRSEVPNEYGLDQPIPTNYVIQCIHPFRNISTSENRPAREGVEAA
jgi:sterol desaturase/sphingolipid hydroxylase (fatty acid hydroxylase superfamily)